MSLRPDWKRETIALSIAAAAGAAAGAAAWFAVRDDIARKVGAGWTAGRDWSFVWMVGLVAAGTVYFVLRRLLRGPRLARTRFLLSVPQLTPVVSDYRTAVPVAVGDLVQRLEARGYQIDAVQVDEAEVEHGRVQPGMPLSGVSLLLRDRRLRPSKAGVLLRISERAAGPAGGLGAVEALDGAGRDYEELAFFVIAELGHLVPGLSYKRGDAGLGPDRADLLLASLPDRPHSL